MRHHLCARCEGLTQCRLLECQEVILDGHTLCWHCAAALVEDFAPEGPDDVFYRPPEPWGGPVRAPLADEPYAHQQQEKGVPHSREPL